MNRIIFDLIFGLSSKYVFLDMVGIFFAKYLPFLLVVGFCVFVLRWAKDWRVRLFLIAEAALVTVLATEVFTGAIRMMIEFPRPFSALGLTPLLETSSNLMHSFPSGHATFFFALATMLYFLNKRWGAWYFTSSALHGLGRIFVGVHWPLDIAGGALVGVSVAFLLHEAVKPYLTSLQHKVQNSQEPPHQKVAPT